MSVPSSELDLIQSVFAPLSLARAGAYGLKDDVAFISASTSGLIVNQDQVIEHTHFLTQDSLDMVARRLVRRNLSDIIAKGGVATAAFLSLAWPTSRDKSGIAQFASGLGEDLDQLCGQCPLMGGDTSVTQGGLVASLTMLGRPTTISGEPVLRSSAQVGDVVAVTGVIGDAYLGLQARLGVFDITRLSACAAFSLAPCPPNMNIASLIGRFAHASIDVSDGLLIDATHIANASGLALHLMLDTMPISFEAAQYDGFQSDLERALALACGGDDYQALITLSESDFAHYQRSAQELGVRVTKVGVCTLGEGVLISYEGQVVDMPASLGWQI